MTKIVYINGERRQILDVNGHTGMLINNKDVGCIAVSTLTSSIVASMQLEDSKGNLDSCHISIKDGSIRLDISPIEYEVQRIKGMFDVIVLGYRLLAEHYPQYVVFKDR